MSSSKLSFDRLGDDLAEVVLSFLSIEDKTRFECLSKKFQSVVYNRQYDFKIDDFHNNLRNNNNLKNNCPKIKKKRLKNLLKKCWAIINIDLTFNDHIDGFLYNEESCQIIEVINKNCQNLLSFKCHYINDCDCYQQFFDKFGNTFKEIEVYRDEDKHFLKFADKCPNLKKVFVGGMETHFLTKEAFPKLKEMKICENSWGEWGSHISMNIPKNISDEHRLEKMKVCLHCDFCTSCDDEWQNDLNQKFDQLSQLKHLKSLKIEFRDFYRPSLIGMQSIANNCNRLKHLSILFISTNPPKLKDITNSVKHFTQIEKLEIKADYNQSDDGIETLNSGSFGNLSHLTHLSLGLESVIITGEFFKNFTQNLPKLQYLHFRSFSRFSRTMVDEIFDQKKLKCIEFDKCTNKGFEFNYFLELMRKCPKLVLLFNNRKQESDEEMVSVIREDVIHIDSDSISLEDG